MNSIPAKIKKLILADDYYKTCARKNKECQGRITWEHAFTYANKQIQEVFSLIPICWRHHLGDLLDKEINHWIAINRASKEDFAKYPNKDWQRLKAYLNDKYGDV